MALRTPSLQNDSLVGINREIGSQYDNVKIVAENIEAVKTDAAHIEQIYTVATNIVDVHVVAQVVVPNIMAILEAGEDAAIVSTKADEAAASAAAALTSEQHAKNSELTAKASKVAAEASATSAAIDAIDATTKANEAAASAIAAHNSELAAEALLDAFNDRYLGSFAVDPVTDNDGQPLLDGALYYNTVNNVLKVYDVSNVMWYTIPQVQLSALLDVQLTSVTTGDILNWNGTKWVNTSSVREHIASTSNPHSVTKTQVGLSNVDNTSDVNKPISTATQTALNLKAPLASPVLTGTPTAPTATVGDSSTKLATTAFVNAEIANDTYLKGTLDTNTTIMSKAAFNALAAERRANRAGSGADEMGKGNATTTLNVNEGIHTSATTPNTFYLGKAGGSGTSKTDHYVGCINGSIVACKYLNTTTTDATIVLPPAPTFLPYNATLTPEQIAMGVIKHADASNSGLIVNGKFDTDTSGWTSIISSLVVESGKLKITNTSTSNGVARQAFTTIIGKEYIVEFEATAGSHNLGVQVKGDSSGITGWSIAGATTGRYTFKYTATTATTYLLFAVYNNALGSYAYVDNIAVYPADAISRSDLVFLETWHEDVSEKDFVYPLGNVQYLGGVTDGMSTIVSDTFSGSSTYSLFGNWQASGALVGKGYVWSGMSDAQKKAFVSNPENNCYLDGDKIIQVRYRMRVVAGMGDSWANVDPQVPNAAPASTTITHLNSSLAVVSKGKNISIAGDFSGSPRFLGSKFNNTETGVFVSESATDSYAGTKTFALPIALVHRRNQGAYHPVYNPNGTKKSVYSGNSDASWHQTNLYASLAQTMTDYYESNSTVGYKANSGYIGTTSGRPDGLFYDQVHDGDITDLRMSSQKVEDYNRLINREFNKLVAGTYRGSEGEWGIVFASDTTSTGNNYLTRLGAGSTRIDYTGNPTTVPSNSTLFAEADRVGTYIKGNDGKYYRVIEVNVSSGGDLAIYLGHEYGDIRSQFTAGTHNFVVTNRSARTKANTLTHTGIIGSPANYPIAWKQSGVSGVPLVVAEDGTSMLPTGALTAFKLSRKANATPLQVLKSTDSGATWTALTVTTHYTFNTTTNAITLVAAPATTDLIMITYQTHTNMLAPTTNAEIVSLGDAVSINGVTYAHFASSLIGKTTTLSTVPFIQNAYKVYGHRIDLSTLKFSATTGEFPNHTSFTLGGGASGVVGVKALPYVTRSNGKARLQVVFKEIKHNGTSFGDDAKFNIVDNVSTTTDNNAQTVLIGQKYAELPYFIGSAE